MIKVKDLSVIYPNGHRAIHDVNFELHVGNTCALVGVNGSGKSTLFNAIMGIVSPQTGEIRIDGKPIEKALKNNLIAYVPQSDSIDYNFPILVKDVVMLGRYGHMNWRRQAKAKDFAKVNAAMERLNIVDLSERQIGELSGGQRKRVFLARALAQESRIILLDEPFTGVDVQTEHAVMNLLKELRTEGYLILVSTHNLGTVPLFCNEVILLNRTVLDFGEVSTIYTAANLERAFGSALKNIGYGGINIVTDDERPAIFVREE